MEKREKCYEGRGKPVFEVPLHVGRPNVGDVEKLVSRYREILEGRWFTNNGPCVQEFERRLEEFLGVRHCIVMCNATVALGLTARALELQGEVIVPSFTFIATAHSLQFQGITPVFCDIDPTDHNIDPECVEEMITPKTTGIVGVHLWGRPCAIEALSEIAARRKLKLMFDAAHAFGCTFRGKMIGGFGNAEVFSFHATKFFNTFEGGAVATNDDELAEKIRLMKNFGFVDYDRVAYIGINGKMSEVSAAMGLTGLDNISEFIEVNRKNYFAYKRGLRKIPGISIIEYAEGELNNFQYIAVEVDERIFGMTRDELIKLLHAQNVIARRYFYPGCHRMEPYRSFFPHAGLLLPHTEELTKRIMTLPTGTAVGEEEIAKICELIGQRVAENPSFTSGPMLDGAQSS